MKISVNKILYHWYSKPINNKSKEIQLSLFFGFYPCFDFNFDFLQQFGNIFLFNIDIFGLFRFNIYKNKEQDHAGFGININILGLDFDFNNKDIRHWDYDNDKWEE